MSDNRMTHTDPIALYFLVTYLQILLYCPWLDVVGGCYIVESLFLIAGAGVRYLATKTC